VPTTIFTDTLNANEGNWNGFSHRQFVPLTGASLGQVRVTFVASNATSGFQLDHASIAIRGSATKPNTQNVPTELLFAGVSGFTLTVSQTIVSDWLTFSALSTDILAIVMDYHAASCLVRIDAAPSAGTNVWYKAASASYNLASVSGFTDYGTRLEAVTLIETQAGAGGGLKFNSDLDGLGASGGFFRDPLAGRRAKPHRIGWRSHKGILRPSIERIAA
jgi:hypothetical protein